MTSFLIVITYSANSYHEWSKSSQYFSHSLKKNHIHWRSIQLKWKVIHTEQTLPSHLHCSAFLVMWS